MEDWHNNMADLITFVATTEMFREGEEAIVTARGDRTALQQPARDMGVGAPSQATAGHQTPQHLHRTLPIPMMAVGPCRQDLATAALSHLQPPSVGLDWEQPLHLSAKTISSFNITTNYTSNIRGYYGLFATILPAIITIFLDTTIAMTRDKGATGYGLDLGKLPVSFTNMLLVSLGEGEIKEPDVRRLDQPLYISLSTAARDHCSCRAS